MIEEEKVLKPWEEPLEEEYWLALLQQGEHDDDTGSETLSDQDRFWQGADGSNMGETPLPDDSLVEAKDTEPKKEPPVDMPSWEEAETCLQEGTILTLTVMENNRGGLVVNWKGWQGFVPASHLVSLPTYISEKDRCNDLAARVGDKLELKIIELDQKRSRLIFSEKAVLLQDDQVEQLFDEICDGDIRRGRVTNLCSFGAFVDLGGIEGLIHISELSWGRVDHPADALQIDQEVDVYVLNVDRKKGRIGLSLKRLQPDPWSSLENRYTEGELVQGVITNVVNFGAFVRVEEGVEGLIHVSELAEGDFMHPRNVVREGDSVTVRIVKIDSVNHRMGLSLKQANSEPVTDWSEDVSFA